jgi:nuclear cap-binding protein subunit 1
MFSYNCEQVVVLWQELVLMNRSIIEQPFKIPFVAAVALYGNEVKPEIAIEAMKRVGDRAQQALNNGEWKEFKLLLRFFACLQPLYEDEGVFTLLGQLFDTVVDLQSANENDVSSLALILNTMSNVSRSLVSSLSRSSSSPFLTRSFQVAAASTNKHSSF